MIINKPSIIYVTISIRNKRTNYICNWNNRINSSNYSNNNNNNNNNNIIN